MAPASVLGADETLISYQSLLCYETAVRNGRRVIVMEPVKGGTLANIPDNITTLLKNIHPCPLFEAIRFAASLKNVNVVLSDMSNMEQMLNNTRYMENFQPLTKDERLMVFQMAAEIQKFVAIACTACHYCTPAVLRRLRSKNILPFTMLSRTMLIKVWVPI